MSEIKQIFSVRRMLVAAALLISNVAFAQAGPTNLNVSGVLFLPSGTPVSQSNVNFRVEIWDKAGTCVLYSEEHLTQDLSQTKGGFALAVGKGTSPNNYLEASALFTSKLFENNGVVAGGWANCTSGATFTAGDERTIRVHYDLGGGFIAMTPDVPIASSAYAVVAETLQGKRPADLIQVRDDVTHDLNQLNIENVFSSTNYARLQQLLSPSAAIGFGSQRLTNIANPTGAQDASTRDYTDKNLGGQTIDLVDVAPGFGGGKVLTWDSGANKWVAMIPTVAGTAGGDLTGSYPNPTVANLAIGTSKLADNAVTPAKIKSAGAGPNQLIITDNLTGSTFNYASCGNNEILKFVTGTGWQCATVASLSAVTSVAGKSGAVTLNAADIGGLGTASLRNIGIGTTEVPELGAGGKLANSVIPNFVGDVTGAIGANIVTALRGYPVSANAPNNNEVLMWNGTAWLPTIPTDNGITALTGDISAAGSGSVVATLTNGVVTTPKMFGNPGANRLVSTDAGSGATLAPFTCNLNQTIQWSGATGWACVNPSDLIGTGFIADGGNTRGSIINIGTNDNFGLNLETNGAPRLTILDDGKVGIGTTLPANALSVTGAISATTAVSAATSLSAGTSITAGTTIGATGNITSGANINAAADMNASNIYATGNMGVGTTSPARILEVAGVMRMAPSALPGAPAAGDLAIDSGAGNSLKYHNGTNWISLAVGGTGDFMANGSVTMSGQFRALNGGTAATPDISFAGDTDNGVFAPAADNFAISTSGTEKLRVVANGNVGIGTTNPLNALDVDGAVAATTTVAAGTSITAGTTIGATGNITSGASITAANNMTATNVYASGNMGVGTTSPARTLEVAGVIRVAPSALPGAPGAGDLAIDAAAGNSLKYHNGTDWISLAVGGTGDFKADGSVAMTGQFRSMTGSAAAPGMTFDGDTDNGIFSPALDNLAFGTSASEKMRILANGNVGIGTTNPQTTFNVAGYQQINYAGTNAYASGNLADVANGSLLNLTDNLNPAGNDGKFIGVSFSSMSAAGFNQGSYIGSVSVTAGTTPATVFGQRQGGLYRERMRISQSGNVGIGTTTPGRLLSVNGLMNVTPTALPGTPIAGDIAIDAAAGNSLKYHNGTDWISLAVGGTGDFKADGSIAMNGQLRSIAGTAANPGITFNGDTDNGIFRPADDNLAFGTAASEKMRILANGNVGIGTTSASRLLEVAGPIRFAPAALPGSAAAGDLAFDSSASNALKFHNGTSWQIVATISGAGYAAAGANADITSLNALTNINGASLAIGNTATTTLSLGAAATGNLTATLGSTAGSSATTVQSGTGGLTLSAAGTSAVTSNRPVVVTPTSLPAGNTAGMLAFDSAASNSLKYNNGASWVTVGTGNTTSTGTANYISKFNGLNSIVNSALFETGGNVGIGTTNPGELLFVSRSDSTPYVSSGVTQNQPWTVGSGAVSQISNSAAADNSASFLTLTARETAGFTKVGYIGILATPSDHGYMLFGGRSLSTGYNERMRINLTDGNVGIGTTSPTRLLQVAGAMKITPTANPGTPTAGDIFVDSAASNALKYHNGSSWVSIGNGTGDFMSTGTIPMSGQFLSSFGTAANPGMTFNGDTDNGIFRPAADNLAFGTSAAERMRILANGYVGIGTTNPAFPLDVTGAIRSTNNLSTFWGIDASDWNQGFGFSGSTRLREGSLTIGNTNTIFLPKTGNVVFNNGGNVGIGTTNPSRLLEVAGPIRISPTALPGSPAAGDIAFDNGAANALKYHNGSTWVSIGNGTGDFMSTGTIPMSGQFLSSFGTAANPGMTFDGDNDNGIFRPAADNLAIGTSGLERLRVLANGNVGIGVTNPNQLLDVRSTGSAAIAVTGGGAGTTGFNLKAGANGYGVYTSGSGDYLGIWSDTAGTAIFGARPNGGLSIGSYTYTTPPANGFIVAGNVGIGVTGPTRLLQVAGAMKITPTGNPGTPTAGDMYVDSGAANILKYHDGTNWISVTTAGTGDFLKNGTVDMTGTFKAVGGAAALPGMTFSGDSDTGIFSPALDNLAFGTSGTEKMRILANGNVGIGTIAPGTYKLSVAGDVFADAIRFNYGTAGSTNMRNPGNATSGIFFPSLHVTSFSTTGVETMRVNSDGNVGIGTTAPTRLLQVAGAMKLTPVGVPSSPTAGDMYVDSGAANTLKYHDGTNWISVTTAGTGDFLKNGTVDMTGTFKAVGGAAAVPGMTFSGDSDTGIFSPALDNLAFGTSAAERVRILANGNVGIGTTNPNFALDVNASTGIRATQNTVASAMVAYQEQNDAVGPKFTFMKSRGPTTAPATGDILGELVFSGYAGGAGFFYGPNVGESSISSVLVGTAASGNNMAARLRFSTKPNGTTTSLERMTILESGNVGIGTTTPTRLLQVAGAMKITPTANPGTPTAGDIYVDSSASNTLTYHNGSAWVAVGSGSGDFLRNGSLAMTGTLKALSGGTAATPAMTFDGDTDNGIYAPSADVLAFGTSGAERMRILSGGNVGIGTTAPGTYNSLFDVQKTQTSTTASFMAAASTTMNLAPSGNLPASANRAAQYGQILIPAGNSSSILNATGNYGYAENNGTGSVFGLYGVEGYSLNSGSTVTTNAGTYSLAENSVGTSTNLIGVKAETFNTSGTATNTYGFYSKSNYIAGTMTNRYGVFIDVPQGAATNDFSFYSANTSRSYFAGNVGIGTTAPSSVLQVSYNGVTTGLTVANSRNTATDGADLILQHRRSAQANGDYLGALSFSGNNSSAAATSYGAVYSAAVSTTAGSEQGFLSIRTMDAGVANDRLTVLGSNVGIGLTGPTRLLQVAGAMKITPTANPGTPTAGDIYVDSAASNALKYHDGTNWITVGSGGGGGDFLKNGTVDMTGALKAASGTVALPGLAFSGDSDTGIFRPTADNLAFGTSATEKMRILANGNVGIGTTNPNALLHVEGGAYNAWITSKVKNGNSGGAGVVDIGNDWSSFSVGLNGSGGIIGETNLAFLTNWTGGPIAFSTNTTERMRIIANGNVGIGTTSPARLLNVAGAMRINPTVNPGAGSGGDIWIDSASANTLKYHNGSAWVAVGSGGATSIDALSDGKTTGASQVVFLGTNSGDVNTGANNTGLGFDALAANTTGTENTAIGAGAIGQGTTASGNTAVGAGALASATIGVNNTAVGNYAMANGGSAQSTAVGYGALMEASGIQNTGVGRHAGSGITTGQANAAFGNHALIFNTTGSYNVAFGVDASAGTAAAARSNNTIIGAGAGALQMASDNNILIGKDAANNLTTGSNNIVIGYDTDAASATAANTLAIGNLIYGTGIDGTGTTISTGNIGIGVTTPTRKLQVAGAMKINPTPNPGTPTAGDIFVDSTATNTLKYHNGSAWVSIGSGTGNFMADGSIDMTGTFKAASGTVALPGITFSGDSDNGIFRPAADNLAFGTAATERMRILANGNVGIGVTTPTALLDVRGGDIIQWGNIYQYKLKNTGGGDRVAIGSSAGTSGVVSLFNNSDLKTVELIANGSSYFVGGNVGIGTTSPASPLHVSGGSSGFPSVSGSTQAAGAFRLGVSGVNGVLDFGVNNVLGAWLQSTQQNNLANNFPLLLNPNGGNVGIGTTTPTRLLQVAGAMKLTPTPNPGTPTAGDIFVDSSASNTLTYHNGSAWVSVGAGGTSSGIAGAMQFSNGSSGFNSDVSNIFFNDATNRLGIGTSAPAETLHVNGSAFVAGQFMVDNNIFVTNSDFVNFDMESATASYFQVGDLGGPILRIPTGTSPGAGNVGIGITNPARRLHVNSAIRITPTTAPGTPDAGDIFVDSTASNTLKYHNGSAWVSIGSGTGDFLANGTVPMTGNLQLNGNYLSGDGGSEGVFVDSLGKVGMGTTTPSHALNVTVNAAGAQEVMALRNEAAYASGTGVSLRFDGQSYTGMGLISAKWAAANNDNAYLAFSTRANDSIDERVRIMANGNLGIGTSTPSRLLQVAGAMKITPTVNPGTPTAGDIFVDSASSNALKYHDGSAWVSVGSGTGNFMADGSIDMTGTLKHAGGTAALPGLTFTGDSNTGIFSNVADTVAVSTNGTEKMRVLASGYVGIGTTAPTYKMSVQGSGDNEMAGSIMAYNGSSTANASTRMQVFNADSGGYLGVYPAMVGGNIGDRVVLGTESDAAGISIFAPGAAQDIRFITGSNSGERMRILSTGNVGIGTTAPGAELHVVGDIQFTGSLVDISDRRLKEDIQEISGGLDIIRQIPTYSFTMKDDPKQQLEYGVMAQDVMNILPDIVRIVNPKTGHMGVSYISLIPWSIRAIQDLDRDVASLKSRVDTLEEQNRKLEQKNKEIEAKLDAILQQLRR